MLLCWRARWSAGCRKIQMRLRPQVWASVRLGLKHTFTRSIQAEDTVYFKHSQASKNTHSKLSSPRLCLHNCLFFFKEVCPRQQRCWKTLIDALLTKWDQAQFELGDIFDTQTAGNPAWPQALLHSNFLVFQPTPVPVERWTSAFPTGAVINVSVLGVGVIYNPLRVQHGVPQAGANK